MCDPSMSCGAECDPSAGAYEQPSRSFSGAIPATYMPRFSPSEHPANVIPTTSSFGQPRRVSETREFRQTFFYPNSETQPSQEFYYSHHALNPPSAQRASSTYCPQQQYTQSQTAFRAQPQSFGCHQHSASSPLPGQPISTEPYPTFGMYSSLPPSRSMNGSFHSIGQGGACAHPTAYTHMQMPNAPFAPSRYSGYGMCTQTSKCGPGFVSPQPQHILF